MCASVRNLAVPFFGYVTVVFLGAVAYIKFDKASSAARAIEVMHEAVLNEGRGPLLKVFLAEAPSTRYALGFQHMYTV